MILTSLLLIAALQTPKADCVIGLNTVFTRCNDELVCSSYTCSKTGKLVPATKEQIADYVLSMDKTRRWHNMGTALATIDDIKNFSIHDDIQPYVAYDHKEKLMEAQIQLQKQLILQIIELRKGLK